MLFFIEMNREKKGKGYLFFLVLKLVRDEVW